MMKMMMKGAIAVTGLLASASVASAGCGLSGGSVQVLANDFPALHAVVSEAEACAGNGVTFTKNHTAEHKDLQVPALTTNPAKYTSVLVANGTLVPLLNDDLVRPLDSLVAAHGQSLKKSQLITIDGQVMAVAFMANAQHLFYREDLLKAAGVGVPQSYEDVVAAAKAIRDKGLMQYPVAGTFKAGWNLGEEFVNMYLGHGGEFFAKGSAAPAVNNAKGVATLEMMKALTAYMNPDFLTYDSNSVQAEWEAGNVALTNLWASRIGAVLDNEGSTPDVVAATRFAAAPTVGGGSIPATTLWWDGFTIAKNISDADAEASFVAMMNGVSAKMANANADKATWLIEGYQPGATSQGILDSASGGAQPYPMVPYMGLMHTALGNELVEYFQGSESAEKALADVEAAYTVAAREAGFLK